MVKYKIKQKAKEEGIHDGGERMKWEQKDNLKTQRRKETVLQ